MILNGMGIIIKNKWGKSEIIRDEIKLHESLEKCYHNNQIDLAQVLQELSRIVKNNFF